MPTHRHSWSNCSCWWLQWGSCQDKEESAHDPLFVFIHSNVLPNKDELLKLRSLLVFLIVDDKQLLIAKDEFLTRMTIDSLSTTYHKTSNVLELDKS